MATEKEYDEIVAPALAEVGSLCRRYGFALIARVEWGKDDAACCGITQVGNDSATIAQKLAQLAAHVDGNFDALCIEAKKRFGAGNSFYLQR